MFDKTSDPKPLYVFMDSSQKNFVAKYLSLGGTSAKMVIYQEKLSNK